LEYFTYSRTPLIRTLVFLIANYPDQLGPSGKFVEHSKKTNLPSNYLLSDQVQYSVMASRTSN